MNDLSNQWLQFLALHGARLTDDEPARVIGFGEHEAVSTPDDNFVAPLGDLGLIAATGGDAANFLHNQLTNDIEHLGPAEARMAGYCSPKGRLLATLLCWRSGDTIMLQLPRQIQTVVQKRLQMFVLRAKAKLRDASDEFVTLGLSGRAAGNILAEFFPQLPSSTYGKQESDAGTAIRLSDANGAPRFQWIASHTIATHAWPRLTQALRAAGPSAWRLTEIRAGIPCITEATQDQFVPQMVNYELIGGVNFGKGCYPGQEIVARSQYLGKLKRRTLLASVASTHAQSGMEVFAATDPGQPCGMIVNAEISGIDKMDCLVEIKVEAMHGASVHLGAADGPGIQFKQLPYPLPDPK